jgi:hypothetical protein
LTVASKTSRKSSVPVMKENIITITDTPEKINEEEKTNEKIATKPPITRSSFVEMNRQSSQKKGKNANKHRE